MNKQRILILDGDSRQGLPFARSLRKAGHEVIMICPWRACPGYFSRYPNKKLIWPDINHYENEFSEKFFDYITNGNCDIVLALGDLTAIFVAKNIEEIQKYCKTPVPNYNILSRAADKSKTMRYCLKNNIPCPQTYNPKEESLDDISEKLTYPIIIKPIRGIGSVGLYRLETKKKLLNNYDKIRRKYGELQIQEFIPSCDTQFQAEAFCDINSKMKVCMVIAKPRFFPVSGGTSTCNVTIDRPDIVETVRRLLEGIQWIGSADVDLILDPRDGIPKVLEINPRVTAGIKIGFDAGIDYADLQVKLSLGMEIPEIKDYKLNKVLRNLCLDILWYRYSSRQQKKTTIPKWWKCIGNEIHYQTLRWDDPFPCLGFVLSNLRKFIQPGVWKSKLSKDL